MDIFLVVGLALLAASPAEPIAPGDPLRCMRMLAGHACASPGTAVTFEAVLGKGHDLESVRALPPHQDATYQRVAACMLQNAPYFVPRFVGKGNHLSSGTYHYSVSPRVEGCEL